MKIILGGIEMGANTDIVLGTPIQGLILPEIRMDSGVYTGRDGGWVNGQFFGMREIVIPGTVNGKSCPDAAALVCSLIDAIPLRQSLPLYVITSEASYYADVYLADVAMEIDSNRIHDFVITVVAPDPNFDEASPTDPNVGWIDDTIYKLIGGGYVTPYILPVEWEAGTTPTTVTNNGSLWVYPQIVLNDKWTNPKITNRTTGQVILLNVTTTTGDQIIIDNLNHTVTLNGGSILPLFDSSSSWWPLQTGDNVIALESSGSGDASYATVRHKNQFTSIYSC